MTYTAPVTGTTSTPVLASSRRRAPINQPRWLHPGAWWVWALGMAVAATRTTNPLLLLLILGVVWLVVSARRPDAPWARSFDAFLRLGAMVIVIRMAFQVLFGARLGTTMLLGLPSLPLPEWMAGVRIGGDITLESMMTGFYDGLRLAVLLICVGAANSLASPARLLKSVPAALYEVGVALVIALTFAPMLVSDIQRVREAQRLRGRATRGLRGVASAALPVFEGALDRSITLAAAMDSRGYGRTAPVSVARRRSTSLLLLGGLVAITIGAYGVVAEGSPLVVGVPLAVVGIIAAALSLRLAGARSIRTRYRPDPWRWQEWLVSASGIIPAIVVGAASAAAWSGMMPSIVPPAWPDLPLLPAVAVLIGALPALAAPPLPRPRAVTSAPPARVPATTGDVAT